MPGKTKRTTSILVVAAAVLFAAGCHNSSGGGGGTGLEFSSPPSQTIDFSLLGIHDPDSDDFDDDCIACHGDLLDQVAEDGVTPMAHSLMTRLYGENNAHCIGCHAEGTDFLAYSAGQLRGQVNVEDAFCTKCHGGDIPGLPQFYVR